MEVVTLDFSEKLKALRKKHGHTQSTLAHLLNVSQNAIYNWENGKREPNLDTILKIADIYGVSIDYLMGMSDKEESLCDMTTFHDEIDEYSHELGEFLYYNPEHKQLFDASMEVKQADLHLATEILNLINGRFIEKDPTKATSKKIEPPEIGDDFEPPF